MHWPSSLKESSLVLDITEEQMKRKPYFWHTAECMGVFRKKREFKLQGPVV